MKKSWKIAFIRQGKSAVKPTHSSDCAVQAETSRLQVQTVGNNLTFDGKVDVTASLS